MQKVKYSKKVLIVYMAIITLAFVLSLGAHAQKNVMRRGNTFICVDSAKSQEPIKTEYLYIDSKGVEYPIYISKSGKYFVKKVSKKTQKEYRQYLPGIQEKLKSTDQNGSKSKRD